MNPATDEPVRPSHRFASRCLRSSWFYVVAFFALVAIFYAEEDWRGRKDWNQYRQGMKARGESLDFADYIPKPVPDEDNFASTPIPKSWFQTNVPDPLTNDLYSRAGDYITVTNHANHLGHRHFEDIAAWQLASVALQAGELKFNQRSWKPNKTFETDKTDLASRAAAAKAVLEGMKSDKRVFEELRSASSRKYSRFPLQYDAEDPGQVVFWQLISIKKSCQRLQLQTCAELADGQTENALADVKLMLYLTDAVKSEPFMISFLVRAVCFQIAVQPLWEGLAEHRWTDSQLQELQTRLQQYDFLADLHLHLKEERIFGVREIEHIERSGLGQLDDMYALENGGGFDAVGQMTAHKRFLDLFGHLMPAGWYDRELLNYCEFFDAKIKGVMDPAVKRVFPSQIASNIATLELQLPPPSDTIPLDTLLRHQAFSASIIHFLGNWHAKAAAAQTTANEAAIACALERYRLANGHFPDALAALAPVFMPHPPEDVITGQPYKYRRTEDGQFVLYSVGWNEKDDGGVPGKQGLFDNQEGDWVWDYPVK